MRTLFDMDARDYPADGHVFRRDSARCVAIRAGRVAMVHSGKYDYYKFPGGGIEPGETPVDAMIRETRDQAGLVAIPSSVREYGCAPRRQRGMYDETEIFAQDNFYYLCDTEEALTTRQPDDYEANERFMLVWVDPATPSASTADSAATPKARSCRSARRGYWSCCFRRGIFAERPRGFRLNLMIDERQGDRHPAL